jgi:DNA-binding CsgD family transcriptional regulator
MSNEQFEQVEGTEVVDVTAAPSTEEAAAEAKDTRVWTLADGTEVSKSEFIRHQFTDNNLSRKEIADQFDINYRTVYGATVNMVNEAEPATRGRSAAQVKILVTPEGDVVTGDESAGYLIGEEAYEGEVVEVDRNTWIKEQVEAGVSRGDVAKKLDVSYGVVYGITKEVAGASARHEIEYNGETLSRSEYIRVLFAEGKSRADIAKELEVDYPVVWSALKVLKSDEDKYTDGINRIKKLGELVVDTESFNLLIEQLLELEVKVEEEVEEGSLAVESTEDTSVYND